MQNLSRGAVCLAFFVLAGLLLSNFTFGAEKIDINTAPLEDLIKIIHLGEIRAKELISLRPFSSLDDLARIKGVGEKRIEEIKKQGLAWVAEAETASSAPAEKLSIIYPANIIINEILPSSEGSDSENEWIEIFNQNNFEVNLSDWQISDMVGGVKTYALPLESKIPAKGYLILTRPTTKITLNNDEDGLKLTNPRGEIIDELSYGKAPKGESYNRTGTNWIWSINLTPGSENIISTPQISKQEIKEEKSEIGSPKIKEKTEWGLAAIGESFQPTQTKKDSQSFSFILIALAIAIFSGAIILLLKKRLGYNKSICRDIPTLKP